MSRRKLLLADDSVTIQKVINLTFADEGVDVISVGDGESALQKVFEMRPDLVMADVHMPGPSGYEICEKIRSAPDLKDLPVVLLVGSFEPFDEGEAKRVGANAYLTKPFQSIRQLVAQVSDLMESSRTGDAEDALMGDALEQAGPETEDIDDLYRASISETMESPALHGEAGFVDAGMDDEIIQTSYSAEGTAPADEDLDIDQYLPAEQPFEAEHGVASETALQDVPSEESSVPAPVDEFAETVEMPIELREDKSESPATSSMSSEDKADFGFDELELLELPPVGSDETIEFTTPEKAEAIGNKAQVVSLSPELMEVIVQKVVERLSEKY